MRISLSKLTEVSHQSLWLYKTSLLLVSPVSQAELSTLPTMTNSKILPCLFPVSLSTIFQFLISGDNNAYLKS